MTDEVTEVTNEQLVEIKNNFIDAMNEDFNTPLALSEFVKLVKFINKQFETGDIEILKQANTLIADFGEKVFGLKFAEQVEEKKNDIPQNVLKLAEERWNAKLSKNWAEADRLRVEIDNLGYTIKDSKENYEIVKKA